MRLTAEAYREAALEHIGALRGLLERRNYALANYTAGLAVECIFRAYAGKKDHLFDSRHNLILWHEQAKFDLYVPNSRRQELAASLGVVATHWSNSQRYCSSSSLRAFFKQAQLDRGIKGDTVKELTRRTADAAFVIVTIGETQWKRLSKKLR